MCAEPLHAFIYIFFFAIINLRPQIDDNVVETCNEILNVL